MKRVHLCALLLMLGGCSSEQGNEPLETSEDALHGRAFFRNWGREIFRHDTFGDEAHWTNTLRMHEVIAAAVDPTTALSVGLKVDADALPPGILETVDLTDPKTTVALLSLDAVVGVKGRVAADGTLESVGITCALCHSIVDDSVAPGIGRRLDGYPNRDLDPGLILSLSPAFSEAQKQVLRSWGKGRYDPRWSIDGINAPVLIPPAYGLKHVGRETYTGDGAISYWNAYVAVTQMGGQGVFIDPRIGVSVIRRPDRVTPKLPALLAYQLSLEAPPPPASSFDEPAAQRGRQVFRGKAKCASCHFGSVFSDAPYRLHRPERVGQDPLYASRSATKRYRTTPLRGAWQHPPYFHDGSAATFDDVVEHYDSHFQLQLSDPEKADLTEYLKSL
jgi:mono/diheme cytochrome c family protein